MARVPGRSTWRDLTVDDAPAIRDFYAAVVGFGIEPEPMGDYEDYSLVAADGERVAGVVHARGPNAGLPPQWLVYFEVEDLDASLAAAEAAGGSLVQGVRDLGSWGRLAVIRDPAGAVAALIEPPS